MPYIVKSFPNQTTTSGAANTASSGITLLDDCASIAIFAPTTTTTGVIVQVAVEALVSTATVWADLKSAGANVIVPTSGCTIVNPIGFRQLRVFTTAIEAANRTFVINGQFPV